LISLYAVRQRSLKKQRAKTYDGTDEDWNNVVSSILNPSKSSPAGSQRQTLDVTCSISGKGSKRTLSITFNNKVEEITQRLGSIELIETEDTDDIDLFGWTSQAVEQRDATQGEILDLKEQVKTKGEIVHSLQQRLDELVEVKADHEKQMLSKFTQLLNEKKLKIRNMQRILATAKPDQKKLKELEAAIGKEPANVAVRNKRPADDGDQDEDEDESEAFETMEVDSVEGAQQTSQSPVSANTTPTASEAEETDEEDVSALPASSSPPRTRAAASHTHNENAGRGEKRVAEKSSPPAATNDDDEETASEDSEL
jgi:hypothetical protein